MIISLSSASKNIVDKYVTMNIIDEGSAYRLLRAEDSLAIIKSLSSLINITPVLIAQIRLYIDDVLEKDGVKTREAESKCLDIYDRELLKQLLRRKGVITRKDALEYFRTAYLLDTAVNNLIDLGILDSFELTNREVILVLNLDFYQKVVTHGSV